MNRVNCPQCGLPAEISDRFSLQSTSGALDHVKIRCPDRHWFTMREEDLRIAPDQSQAEPVEVIAARSSPELRAAAAVPVLAARLGLL